MVCVLVSLLKLWAWITQPYFTKQQVTMVTQIMETDESVSLFPFLFFPSLLDVSQLLTKWNISVSSRLDIYGKKKERKKKSYYYFYLATWALFRILHVITDLIYLVVQLTDTGGNGSGTLKDLSLWINRLRFYIRFYVESKSSGFPYEDSSPKS